jgi:hypothetical protein
LLITKPILQLCHLLLSSAVRPFTRTSNIKIKSKSKNVILRALFISAAIAIAAIGAAPAATAAPPYKNCTAARADGRHDIPIGDPGYGDWLDRDHDGIACES